MIADLQTEFPELSRLAHMRPRVCSERIGWAFLSAIGAGFIASGITSAALSVFWSVLVPDTQPHPEWLTTFLVARAAQLIAMAAVALRAGGVVTLALCFGYEAVLFIAQLPGRIALCGFIGADPDPGLRVDCDPLSLVIATWPIWLGLIAGAIGARWLLPPTTAGSNILLRAAGAFSLTLTAMGNAFMVLQLTILHLPGPPSADAAAIAADVAVSAFFVVVELGAGVIAGALLRRARTAAVLLVALLVVQGIDMGLTLVRTNVDQGVPHPPELAFLQSTAVLTPIAAVLGIAIGRLLARRNLLVSGM